MQSARVEQEIQLQLESMSCRNINGGDEGTNDGVEGACEGVSAGERGGWLNVFAQFHNSTNPDVGKLTGTDRLQKHNLIPKSSTHEVAGSI